jgi:hypothetical protein
MNTVNHLGSPPLRDIRKVVAGAFAQVTAQQSQRSIHRRERVSADNPQVSRHPRGRLIDLGLQQDRMALRRASGI